MYRLRTWSPHPLVYLLHVSGNHRRTQGPYVNSRSCDPVKLFSFQYILMPRVKDHNPLGTQKTVSLIFEKE